MRPYTNITDPSVGKALAHPLRIRILSLLEQRTASPSEIADELDVPLTNVSYHVRHLHRLGVIKLVRRSVRRGAVQHYYRAEARPQVTDEAWSAVPEIVKRAALGNTLRDVAEQVNAAAAAGGFARAEAGVTQVGLRLDERGFKAVAEELEAVRGRIATIEKDAAKRLSTGADASDSAAAAGTAVLMLFESASPPAPEVDGGKRRRTSGSRRRRS